MELKKMTIGWRGASKLRSTMRGLRLKSLLETMSVGEGLAWNHTRKLALPMPCQFEIVILMFNIRTRCKKQDGLTEIREFSLVIKFYNFKYNLVSKKVTQDLHMCQYVAYTKWITLTNRRHSDGTPLAGRHGITLEPHYNAHFEVHSDISVITEQPYNEGLIHRKYKQWEPCL